MDAAGLSSRRFLVFWIAPIQSSAIFHPGSDSFHSPPHPTVQNKQYRLSICQIQGFTGLAVAVSSMAQVEAAGHLRDAQTALIQAMETGELGEKESEIDHMQEKLEDYAIDLDPEFQSSA